jgi:hypothetical protein
MERHVTPESRLQVMEEATSVALSKNAEEASRIEAVNERLNSPEAEVLNNQAELAVFGDGGDNGQTDYEVKSLNEAGEVVVEYKFKDTEPLRGLIDVRANPRYGKTSSERDKAADKYIREFKRLIKKESLQPAQAKLLMDMKMDDAVSASEQVDARVRSGEKRSDASKAVKVRYEKKFAAQLELVRSKGIMTAGEYEQARSISSSEATNEIESDTDQSPQSQEIKNSFDSAPNLSTRRVEQRQIDAANYALVKAAAEGDEELFSKAEAYLRNEVTANEMITGVKGLDAFNKVIAEKRKELDDKKNANSKPRIALDLENDDRLSDEQRKILKDKWAEQTAVAPEPLPEIVEQTPVAVPPIPPAPNPAGGRVRSNNGERRNWRRGLAAAGLGVLAAAGLVAANHIDDNYIDKDQASSEDSEKADELRNSGAFDGGGTSTEEAEAAEQMKAIENAVEQRTAEISDAEGSTPWARYASVYGAENATRELISAVEALQADGVDAQWHGNPLTDRNAWISISDDPNVPGNSDVNFVTNRLAQASAEINVAEFLGGIEE